MLSRDTDLIILDEPTNGLDMESIDKLLYLLKQLKRDKIIIIISHDSKVESIYDEKIYL